MARYAGAGSWPAHAGDAIDQEARATRSRAGKRSWTGQAPRTEAGGAARVLPPGGALAGIGPLPVAALRLERAEVETLQALGLRRIVDLVALPRAQLARRAGPGVLTRLDQALGRLAEPVAADRPPPVFALRMTFPEPIGLEADVLAGIDRLLPPLCARLQAAGRGARRVRLTLVRTDGRAERREVGLARPADRPEAIRPLLALRLGEIDAGFGIERMRLEAVEVEPLARGRRAAADGRGSEAFADLLGRLGARLGIEAVIRLHPADSHIPEKSATEMAAAFSAPAAHWPPPAAPRPILIFPPEPITPQDDAVPPAAFVWRRRPRRRAAAFGPERIAPEWWLDDPAWRSGARDYWRVETEEGERLWLFAAQGGELPAGAGSRRVSSRDRPCTKRAPGLRGSGRGICLLDGSAGVRAAQHPDRLAHLPPLLGGLAVALGGGVLGLLRRLVLRPVAVRRVELAGIVVDLDDAHRFPPSVVFPDHSMSDGIRNPRRAIAEDGGRFPPPADLIASPRYDMRWPRRRQRSHGPLPSARLPSRDQRRAARPPNFNDYESK